MEGVNHKYATRNVTMEHILMKKFANVKTVDMNALDVKVEIIAQLVYLSIF